MLSLSDLIKSLQIHDVLWNSINILLMIHPLHPFAPMLHMVYMQPIIQNSKHTPAQVDYGRDMIINATYIANWKAIAAHHAASSCNNNEHENSNRLPFNYQVGHYAYVRVSNLTRKLEYQEGPFFMTQVHTNGMVTIQHSPAVTEYVNICRLHPA
jgi:coproporphyrinogen III oxidase